MPTQDFKGTLNRQFVGGAQYFSIASLATKTITVTCAGYLCEFTLTGWVGSLVGDCVLKFIAAGYLADSTGYNISEIVRYSNAGITLSAVTRGDGSFSFTITNDSATHLLSGSYYFISDAETTVTIT